MNQPTIVKPGDIMSRPEENGEWQTVKILEVDQLSDGSAVAHCLWYETTQHRPDVSSLSGNDIRIWHTPLAGDFATDWERLGNVAVAQEELFGFIEYLRRTDFPRYIDLTGQDLEEIVNKACEHYNHANTLVEQHKHKEAIMEYSTAIELCPPLYEAFDNRALTYMELGELDAAISDFEQSLRINPNGGLAFFSRGECLLRLGELQAAEEIFTEGLPRFPEHQANFMKLLAITQALHRKK